MCLKHPSGSGSTSKLSCTMYRGEQNPEIWHIRASFLNTSKHTLQICNFALQFVCHSLLNLLDQNPQNKAFPLKYTLSFSLCNSEKSMESHWCCNDCPCNLWQLICSVSYKAKLNTQRKKQVVEWILEPEVSAQVGLFRSCPSNWDARVCVGAAAASNVNTFLWV